MAEADKDQKTHDPTEKKLADARQKGDVPSTPEMRHALMFVAAIIIAGSVGAATLARLRNMFTRLWGSADDFQLDPQGAQAFATGISLQLAAAMTPIMLLIAGFSLLTVALQGRPSIAWTRVAPKWSKLSPLAGMGRIFGKRALIEFAKTLAKFTTVILVTLVVIWPKAVALDQLIGAAPDEIGRTAGALVYAMIKSVAMFVCALALFDFIYQRRAFIIRMRMSLQEIKDEHKQSEGDPKIKAKIRAIGMQRSRQRMMAAVPGASVIITNPTHYAIALKYSHGDMAAPVVVAKGVDEIALRIREAGKAANVPIIENAPLARALYAAVKVDQPIPAEYYAAVAEIIGFVMRLSKKMA